MTYNASAFGKQNNVLTQNADDTYTLNCGNTTFYTFNADGSLASVRNKTGMKLTVSQDEAGNLIVTEPVSGKTRRRHTTTTG
ncbi:MAG: hypothetical protein ABF449_08640 [Ethanoligenens sp.]